jgi:hypothetical protein
MCAFCRCFLSSPTLSRACQTGYPWIQLIGIHPSHKRAAEAGASVGVAKRGREVGLSLGEQSIGKQGSDFLPMVVLRMVHSEPGAGATHRPSAPPAVAVVVETTDEAAKSDAVACAPEPLVEVLHEEEDAAIVREGVTSFDETEDAVAVPDASASMSEVDVHASEPMFDVLCQAATAVARDSVSSSVIHETVNVVLAASAGASVGASACASATSDAEMRAHQPLLIALRHAAEGIARDVAVLENTAPAVVSVTADAEQRVHAELLVVALRQAEAEVAGVRSELADAHASLLMALDAVAKAKEVRGACIHRCTVCRYERNWHSTITLSLPSSLVYFVQMNETLVVEMIGTRDSLSSSAKTLSQRNMLEDAAAEERARVRGYVHIAEISLR